MNSETTLALNGANSSTPEPFGFFKAGAFDWTDCAETDEGAQPLYDQAAIDRLIAANQRLGWQISLDNDHMASLEESILRLAKQRDDLLAAGRAVVARWDSPLWKDQPHTAEFIQALREAIASVERGEA